MVRMPGGDGMLSPMRTSALPPTRTPVRGGPVGSVSGNNGPHAETRRIRRKDRDRWMMPDPAKECLAQSQQSSRSGGASGFSSRDGILMKGDAEGSLCAARENPADSV